MPSKLERFTQRARRVLSLAQEDAERLHHAYIGTEHLLLGLMREEGGVAGRVLRDLGVEPRRVLEMVEHLTGASRPSQVNKVDLAPGTRRVLELAVDEARRMGHHYIGTEHLLLGLVRQNEGVAMDVLRKLGISVEQIRRQTRRVLQETQAPGGEPPKEQSLVPGKFERFTQRARHVLSLAQEEAEGLHHAYIGTEHLLLGLIREEGGVAGRVLRDLGVEARRVLEMVERLADASQAPHVSRVELAPGTRQVLELAVDEARRMGHDYLGTEHLLLGIVRDSEGVAMDVLRKLGISEGQIRRQTRRVLLEEQAEQERSRGPQESPPPIGKPHLRGYSLALIGFGNVGKALVRLLHSKTDELREKYGIEWRITGVATRRMKWIARPSGLDVNTLLDISAMMGQAVERLEQVQPAPTDIHEWLAAARPDVVFELTSMNPHTGQPAIDYIKAALEYGAHVVTANKGPVVHAYHELRDLAAAKGRGFLFEATVMGGAPIFSLFREALPAANLKRFRGILNSTTNLMLSEMEQGASFEQAVKAAQELGIAETDPSFDVDGWDAAVKVSALATVLMDASAPLKPQDVQREGIRALTPEMVQRARAEGRPYKLVCKAEKQEDGSVAGSVKPEPVAADDPLASVNGANSMVTFEMDTLYGLTLGEQHPDAMTTAYGPLADLIAIARGPASFQGSSA